MISANIDVAASCSYSDELSSWVEVLQFGWNLHWGDFESVQQRNISTRIGKLKVGRLGKSNWCVVLCYRKQPAEWKFNLCICYFSLFLKDTCSNSSWNGSFYSGRASSAHSKLLMHWVSSLPRIHIASFTWMNLFPAVCVLTRWTHLQRWRCILWCPINLGTCSLPHVENLHFSFRVHPTTPGETNSRYFQNGAIALGDVGSTT